jgi:iron(III) transport system permease protein
VTVASTVPASPRFPSFGGQSLIAVVIIYAGLAVTVVLPLLAVIYQAAFAEDGLSVRKVVEVLSSPTIVEAIVNTMLVSAVTVVLAGSIGVTLAWLVARSNMPFKRVFDPLNMIPFYLSSIVGALSWQVIAAPRTGIANTLLEPILGFTPFDIYSAWGIAFVLGLFYAPYVYLFTLGSLQSMDAALEEAARMSGAGNLQTALRITLPLSGPAILSASILVFVTSAGIFGVPLVLGVPGRVNTLSTLIYRYIAEYPSDFAAAAVLSVTLFLFTMVLTALQLLLLRGRRFTTVTGKGYRPRTVDLGAWRWAGAGINALYLLFVIVPFLALLLVSLQDAWTGSFEWARLTLANYHQVMFVDVTAKRGLVNSLIISTVGATIGVAVSLLLALVLQRTRLPGRRGITWLSMLPVTVPGIVLGFGFLAAFVSTPLYGTIWLIMLAYIVHYLPTGLGNTESLVQAVSRELDESARMSGATWWRAMSRIVLPLVAPGLVSIWLLLFVTFIREVSASMMLFTYGTETMSIALIRIMEYEPYGVSGAFGVLQTLLLLGCVAFIRQLSASRQSSQTA